MIQIEKDIPIPKVGGGVHKEHKYPLCEMEVGDSFFVSEGGDTKKERTMQAAIISMGNRRYPGKKFTSRKVKGGIRFWRIK